MKYIYVTVILLITVFIIYINGSLHTQNHTRQDQKDDVLLQLQFLEAELKNNDLGIHMQQLFPEGFVFVNALYGLSWCELSQAFPNDSALKEKALNEALYAYGQLESEQAKSAFPEILIPEHGIFYTGWKNYLLSNLLGIDRKMSKNQQYITLFKDECDRISNALKASKSPYLESYPEQCWPADMFVAIASLNNYDKIIESRYEEQITKWVKDIKKQLDPNTHMIPHKINRDDGKVLQGTRGCSIVLILRMLAEINPTFAQEQFRLFDSLFLDKTMGLPSVREYPKGTYGIGDIDSGPVILGVGFSATIVMIGTYSVYKKHELSEQQYKTIHAFGFSKKNKLQKKYLWGKLPMADAFIAWGRATDLHYSTGFQTVKNNTWSLTFHLFSFFIIAGMWVFYFRKTIIRKVKNALLKSEQLQYKPAKNNRYKTE